MSTGDHFATIQAAVDAASPGDVLEVATLDHLEGQVELTTSVTLRGATGAEVVRMAADTGDSGDDRAWFLVPPGVDVAIANLSFEGAGRQVYQAFRVRGRATFDRCAFRDVRFDTYQGTAIVAFGDPVQVVDSTFEQIGRIGVFLFGAGVGGSIVDGISYVGKGAGDHLDYGIEIGGGASALVRDSMVRDCLGVAGDGSESGGVLVSTLFGAGTVAEVIGSELIGNRHGILGGSSGDASRVTARFNRLVDNELAGMTVTSSIPAVAEVNWWGCNGGPGAPGCDELAGSGIASVDPWLVLGLSLSSPMLEVGDSTLAVASLTFDSNGVDTSTLDALADGVPVTFSSGGLGAVQPASSVTSEGEATTTFSALAAGIETVQSAVDGEIVAVDVTISPRSPPVAVPTMGPYGHLLLALLVVSAGIGISRHRNGILG